MWSVAPRPGATGVTVMTMTERKVIKGERLTGITGVAH